MFHDLFKKVMPVAALAMAAGLAGCDGGSIAINGQEGVPLGDLDMTGGAPTEVVLAGPDTVKILEGGAFDIKVEGPQEAIDGLRFSLSEGTLGITRDGDNSKNGAATVLVTMPAPDSLTMLGSGSLEANSLARDAKINVMGSGQTSVAQINADALDVNVAGSGSFTGAGTSKTLDVTVAGSGSAKMARLKVNRAEVTVAGSGDADFASDGTVEASIMGSGNVTVSGSATCTVSTMGSGTASCEKVVEQAKD